ncbi:hypothetical protein MJ391_21605 [Escherichia coli]|nr:hypothetical protein MJ391_21605 [Escherichia coli]
MSLDRTHHMAREKALRRSGKHE